MTAEAHPWLDGCFTIRGTGDLEQLESFRSGHFLVQDAASKLAVLGGSSAAGDAGAGCLCGPGREELFCRDADGQQGADIIL